MRLAVMLWTLAVLFAGSPPARLEATPWPAASVELGDEVFLRETWHELHGRCIGIVTNQTGVTSQLESLVDAVRRNPAICLKAIYAPEHGFRGDRPAGAYVPFYTDERTGLPVYSLYGASRHPTAAMLAGVDVLLFDIQDVGDRTYTYISTLAYVMQAAQAQKKEVWVLDRPNPMGGETIEGPVLEPHLSSFIGLYPLPVRHGMTVGELAQMYRGRFGIDCALRVVPMRGWKRSMLWSETGLAWVQTSPNIPEWDTTLVYPATGLIESAGVNNGTGYTKPFKYAGAPGLDGAALAAYLNARPIPGVHFRPAAWAPISGFWQGKTLTGVELAIFDPHAFRAVRTAVELLVAVRKLAPRLIQIPDPAGLDREWGTESLRLGLEGGLSVETILDGWQAREREFSRDRTKYLLY